MEEKKFKELLNKHAKTNKIQWRIEEFLDEKHGDIFKWFRFWTI